MLQKRDIYTLLEERKIPFTIKEHPPVYTMEEMERLDLPDSSMVLKNLFLRDDKKRSYYLVSMMQDKRANLKELASKLQSRPLSFAKEEELENYLGLKQGHVTPLGILNDVEHKVRMLFDNQLIDKKVWIHPMDNRASIYLSFEDLIELLQERGHQVELLEL